MDVYRCDETNIIHKLILFYYITNWFFIILNTFLIYKVISILSNAGNKSLTLLLIAHKLKYFPIIHIITILPSTVSRVYNLLDLEPNFTLALLQTIFGSAAGIGYLVVYLLIPQVNQSLKFLFERLFNRQDKSQDINNTSLDISSDYSNYKIRNKKVQILK